VACLILGFRGPRGARTQSRFKHLLIISIILPLFVGNAVRAEGGDDLRQTRARERDPQGLCLTRTPLELMFTERTGSCLIAVNCPSW